MKQILIFTAIGFLFFSTILNAQTYLISSEGTVSTCSGTFYDSGGAASDYGHNENYVMTFCSDNGGRIQIDFSNVAIANGDVLNIYYGNAVTATPDLTYANVNGINPAIITSTCDCITFQFTSNASGSRAGWVGEFSCTAPTLVSNDLIFNGIAPPLDGTCLVGQTNIGATADYTFDCFTGGQTVWYDVTPDPGNNTITVTTQNATFTDGNIQYLLIFGNCPGFSTYIGTGAQCVSASDIVQWTDLREGQYYLGVTSTAGNAGNFDLCVTQSWIDHCGDYYCGSTETCNTCPFDCGACPEATGGPYYHPTLGIQNTYLGQCMVTTCSGTYYDNGGPGVTYANDINQIYRTFCPDTPNMAMRATVVDMGIEFSGPGTCLDRLFVQNGPTQNSPTIWSGCNTLASPYPAAGFNGGVFTSTHPSGCLTFRFSSNASNTAYWEGWEIELSCVPFAGNPGNYNNDCVDARPICSDVTVSSEVYGPGQNSDGCGGCVTSENFTEWYRMVVATSGTMELSINPVGNSDMDFALYQSDDCDNLGPPVRCSYAAYQSPGKTGMRKGEGDLSEDVSGDQWVAEIAITAGETYYLMINEWDKNNPNSYSLDFTLTDGASFDCSIVLPVELTSLKADCSDSNIKLQWETASEMNNDYFSIERSFNGLNFETIAQIEGAGISNELRKYAYYDELFSSTVYYRLKQTDYDGTSTTYDAISVTCGHMADYSMTIADHSDDGYIEIFHDAVANTSYVMTITDAQGRIIHSKQYIAEEMFANHSIDTRNMAAGIYVVNVISSVNNHSQKMMIK